jgi:hypothetical protein
VGAGIAGARVDAWVGGESVAQTMTDATGAFEFTTLPVAGAYRVAASMEDAVGGVAEGVVAGERSVKLTLGDGLDVSGTLLKPDGTPAAGMWFSAERVPGEFREASAFADEHGRFELSGRAPGSHVLRAFDPESNRRGYDLPATATFEADKDLIIRCVARPASRK